MESRSPRWQEITPSEFPWEREALAFVRERLPDNDPYRAWSNFEFIAEDGSIYEVDLLVLTPKGFYLIEIKSRPGTVEGDQGTWSWHQDGRVYTVDNPLVLANRKAKKLISLLRRQPALQKLRSPFLEPLVFLSAEQMDCRLVDYVRSNVVLRDRAAADGKPERLGIVAALTRWAPEDERRTRLDRPMAKAVARAMEEAGIRPSQRARQVGDWRLDELLLDGPSFQDWSAKHVALNEEWARVRIYGIARDLSAEDREARLRAAQREYQILRGIHHEGIVAAKDYKEHALGPALIFDHRPGSQRLDHYLAERGAKLSVDARLDILRQVADALRYAHEKRLIHRALSPQSILVLDPQAAMPRVQIYNWQVAARDGGESRASGPNVTATSHLEDLVEEAAWVYMAPEAVTERAGASEQLDVFSLGALAFHLFAGRPPASSFQELTEKLREGKGLRISDAMDGAWTQLQLLVQYATHPEVTTRLDSVADFLRELDKLEEEITAPPPDERLAPDPTQARPGDMLDHGFVVKRRLGKGSTAVALLVDRDGKEQVLKVALTPAQNDRLRAEGEVLRKLRHAYIVELFDVLSFGERVGLVMAKAGDETLADRLRAEGRIHLELLERFGEDLLGAVDFLEQKGIPHRDIKPENLGVLELGSQRMRHLMLFDFSLSRAPAENILAGTRGYLDPFLSQRKPPRWDTHAERFAAAATLYQMATGALPTWGDGQSEPAVLDCEATIDANGFEPAVREGMHAFFAKALKRDFKLRFDNTQDMLRDWRSLFAAARRPEALTDHGESPAALTSIESARLDTRLGELGLTARALSALERVSVRTVEELLRFPLMHVNRMRGVGYRTRKEITEIAKQLAVRFPDVARGPKRAPTEIEAPIAEADARASIDELVRQVLPAPRGEQAKADAGVVEAFLGLSGEAHASADSWPSQSDVARALGTNPVAVSQALLRARARWRKSAAVTQLRHDLIALLDAASGIATARELADAVLARRGSVQEEPVRSCFAAAAVRAAVETERDLATQRWLYRRPKSERSVLVARDEVDQNGETRIDGQRLADWAEKLGREADRLATQDPLPAPGRVLDALQAVACPGGFERPQPSRLLQLAVATAKSAALSSRLELYPRGLEARRALRLALGALSGAQQLTAQEIRERVAGRYPDAEPLPDRPALDALLAEVAVELSWQPDRGAYVAPLREFTTVLSGTTTPRTTEGAADEEDLSVHDFDERLRRAIEQKRFLALVVAAPRAIAAERALTARFPLDVRSFDELLIRHMKEEALKGRIDWQVVLRADAAPHASGEWSNLMLLVKHRALPRVRAELADATRPLLLTNLGLLARYEQMHFLDELRDTAGKEGGAPGVLLLANGDSRPEIDGQPVPVFTPGQWARIPSAWLAASRTVRPRGETS